jgi:putative methionine-R-sulfoxide reductase with GAF domain
MIDDKSPIETVQVHEDIEIWRAQLLKIMFRVLAAAGALTLVFAVYDAYIEDDVHELLLRIGIYLGLLTLSFWPGISYKVQAIGLMLIFGAFAAWNLTEYGLNAESGAFFLTIPIIATLFFGIRGGRWAIGAVLLTLMVITWLFVTEQVVVYNVKPTRSADLPGWLVHIFIFFGLSAGMVFAQNFVLKRLGTALNESRRLAHALEQERAGLEIQVNERTRKLEEARRTAETANIALQEQMWRMTCQSKLNDVLRGEHNLTNLANNAIRQLCQYVEAPVGIIYLLKEDHLHRIGQFAYNPPPNTPNAIRLGEGLEGQVALDGKKRHLKNISEPAWNIVSGLGSSPPQHLLIVPFIYEDRVAGVIEIGSWHAITKAHVQLIEQAQEKIAIAFNTALNRERITQLLEETQRQTEELQAQEEELRAMNEELQAQAEHLAERLDEQRETTGG